MENTYVAYSVSTPPNTCPSAPPIGAPAENVANAVLRARDGGKEWANIPIAAGTVEAGPAPAMARRTMIWMSVWAKEHPIDIAIVQTAPISQTSLRP